MRNSRRTVPSAAAVAALAALALPGAAGAVTAGPDAAGWSAAGSGASCAATRAGGSAGPVTVYVADTGNLLGKPADTVTPINSASGQPGKKIRVGAGPVSDCPPCPARRARPRHGG
jgi:hypothetical protein